MKLPPFIVTLGTFYIFGSLAAIISPLFYPSGNDVLALRNEVIGEVWLNCAERPGDDLCLELGLRTLTGDRYWFRDRDWRAGGNRQILALFDYLQANYRSARFDRKTVETVR